MRQHGGLGILRGVVYGFSEEARTRGFPSPSFDGFGFVNLLDYTPFNCRNGYQNGAKALPHGPYRRDWRTAGMGRFLPNALRQGKRLLYAQNLPFKLGFTIFQIERLLLREKQTLDCLESGADGR